MSDKINGMTQEQAQYEERNSLISKIFTLEKKVRESEREVDKLMGIANEKELEIIKLKQQMKKLQEESDGYKNGQIQLQGMIDDLMDVNAKWAKRVKRLREAVDLVIGFIPEGFEIPLGFNQVMTQLKKVRDEV
jgi:uncharacterized coiled-coil DUF342 family protein